MPSSTAITPGASPATGLVARCYTTAKPASPSRCCQASYDARLSRTHWPQRECVRAPMSWPGVVPHRGQTSFSPPRPETVICRRGSYDGGSYRHSMMACRTFCALARADWLRRVPTAAQSSLTANNARCRTGNAESGSSNVGKSPAHMARSGLDQLSARSISASAATGRCPSMSCPGAPLDSPCCTI